MHIKKCIAGFLMFMLGISFIPSKGFAEIIIPAPLQTGLVNIFSGNRALTSNMNIIYENNALHINIGLQKENQILEEKENIKLELDLGACDETLSGKLTADIGLTYMFTQYDQKNFLTLHTFDLKAENASPELNILLENIKKSIEPVLGRTFNINDLLTESYSFSALTQTDYRLSPLRFMEGGIAQLWMNLLQSGMFEITTDIEGLTYSIHWAVTPEITNFKEFLENMIHSLPFPEKEYEQMYQELSNISSGEIIAFKEESKEFLKMLKEYVDFSIIFNIRGESITDVEVKANIALNKMIPGASMLQIDGKSSLRHYMSPTLVGPSNVEESNDLLKTLEGASDIFAFFFPLKEELTSAEEFIIPDYTWDIESRESLDIEREHIRMNPDSQWYEEYIYHVNSVLSFFSPPLEPQESTKMHQLYSMLKEMLYYKSIKENPDHELKLAHNILCKFDDSVFDTDVSTVLWYAKKEVNTCITLDKNETVYRKDGLSRIIRMVFGESMKDPIAFAVENGFVSKEYTAGKNAIKPMNHAELAKIFSKILDYLDR